MSSLAVYKNDRVSIESMLKLKLSLQQQAGRHQIVTHKPETPYTPSKDVAIIL